MRGLLLLAACLLLAPSVLGSAVLVEEGTLRLACTGVSIHSSPPALREAMWVGQGCRDGDQIDAVSATGGYVATFSWEAGGYPTLTACLFTEELVARRSQEEGTLTVSVEESCATGASPLVLTVPASARDDLVTVFVTPPSERGRITPWVAPASGQAVSYALSHDPETPLDG